MQDGCHFKRLLKTCLGCRCYCPDQSGWLRTGTCVKVKETTWLDQCRVFWIASETLSHLKKSWHHYNYSASGLTFQCYFSCADWRRMGNKNRKKEIWGLQSWKLEIMCAFFSPLLWCPSKHQFPTEKLVWAKSLNLDLSIQDNSLTVFCIDAEGEFYSVRPHCTL